MLRLYYRFLPILGVALLVGFASPRTMKAELIYVDAEYNGNTTNAATDSATDWALNPIDYPNESIRDDNLWEQRTSGPGAAAYQSDAWQAWGSGEETVPTLITTVTGLEANATYGGLRLYFIGKESLTEEWYIDASVDGTNFTTYLDGSANANPVNTSNNGVGAAITAGSGDTRYYVNLPNATTDGDGNLKIWIRQGTNPGDHRTVYDGIAYETVVVPEPSTFVLAIFGIVGLFGFARWRRRK